MGDVTMRLDAPVSSPFTIELLPNNVNSNSRGLDITFPLAYNDVTLSEWLCQNKDILVFLRITGGVWPVDGDSFVVSAFQYVWNSFLIICLLTVFVAGILQLIQTCFVHWSAIYVEFTWLFDIPRIIQAGVLLPSIWRINYRLKNKVALVDLDQYKRLVSVWCYPMLFISILIGLIAPVYTIIYVEEYSSGYDDRSLVNIINVKWECLIIIAIEVAISCVMASNLLFMLVDCKVAILLVDQLMSDFKANCFSLKKLNDVRNEIKGRVKMSSYISYSLVLVAILDIVGILSLLIKQTTFDMLPFACLFIMEYPFLFVLFFNCAKVNETADKLTRTLGSSDWDMEKLGANSERVIFYINTESNRISFPLAGIRMNYKDITRQLVAFCITIFVALVKVICYSA